MKRELASGPKLAKKFSLSLNGVLQRIDAFIDQIPLDGRGDNLVAHWSAALIWARDRCQRSRSKAVLQGVESSEPVPHR